MLKLLEHITQSITDNKDIEVTISETDGVKTFTVHAPKEVMGLLIGKEGKTIRAIRSLARARAIIDQEKVFVNIEENSTEKTD
jgi:predicted RNA-binding protein YlqC (UPF0109 family)